MAKLPVIMFLCAAVLGWTIFGVVFFYILAIFTGILFCGLGVLQKPAFRRATLRDYASTVFKNLLEFFKRISVGLMIAVAVLYTLQYFGLLLPIAAMLAPIFSPLGLDNPALVVALIFGLIGKEMIIGVILSFGVSNIGFTSISALCFLVFVIFYTPCLPTLTAIKAKLGTAAAVKTAAYNFFVAYFLTFAAYMVAVLISFC
jgi:ferrous iron transport protein B